MMSIVAWAGTLVLLVWSIVASVRALRKSVWDRKEYWLYFHTNQLPTMLTVILGVPIAVELSSWQEVRAQHERGLNAVEGIRNELAENARIAGLWDKALKERGCLSRGMQTSQWDIACQLGDAKAIEDRGLLAGLGAYYAMCKDFNRMQDRFMEVETYVGVDLAGPDGVSNRERSKRLLIESLGGALVQIAAMHEDLQARIDAVLKRG